MTKVIMKEVNNNLEPTTMTEIDQPISKPRLFKYPELPIIERVLYFTFGLSFFFYWMYLLYGISQKIHLENDYCVEERDHWILGRRYQDIQDQEWKKATDAVVPLTLALVGHSFVFWMSAKSSPDCSWVQLVYALIVTVWLHSWQAVATLLVFATYLFTIAHFSRNKIVTGLSAAPLVPIVLKLCPYMEDRCYIYNLLVSYGILHCVSFVMEMIDGNLRAEDKTIFQKVYRMSQYVFYLPYAYWMIVTYDNWERQIKERNTNYQSRNWKQIGWLAVRVVFSAILVDTILYYLLLNCVVANRVIVPSLNEKQLIAVGVNMAMWFSSKYFVLFSSVSVFAQIDGLQPFEPPHCIATFALGTKAWRNFDRGLYRFFQRYIYKPICRPTFSAQRKLTAMLSVFFFVLVWHGFHEMYIVWVLMNILAIFIEVIAKSIWLCTSLPSWQKRNLSDEKFHRLLCALQILPMNISCFSMMFFVLGKETGYRLIRVIFWENMLRLTPQGIIMWALWYLYCSLAAITDTWRDKNNRQKSVKLE